MILDRDRGIDSSSEEHYNHSKQRPRIDNPLPFNLNGIHNIIDRLRSGRYRTVLLKGGYVKSVTTSKSDGDGEEEACNCKEVKIIDLKYLKCCMKMTATG